ncbi:MAG: MFS transporter [Chloroflexota bacterium]
MTAVHVTNPLLSEPHDRSRTDYPRVGLMSLGHLSNDMYGNLITALMPYLVIQGKITAVLSGFILLVYLLGSSVLQPFFGLMSDRHGHRVFAVAGPICVGICAAFVGWAPNVESIFALAAVAGIGTAAFHPQAASMVSRISSWKKGWAMSLFSMGGNVGFALGPILAALIATVGLHWSPVIIVPGVAVTLFLLAYAPSPTPKVDASVKASTTSRTPASSVWRPLSLIVGVIATRSAVQYALILFLPLYYHSKGFPAQLGSYYAFVVSISGAFGGLAGGYLSDRYGRKPITVVSLAVASPLLLMALLASGPIVWPLLAATGALLLASNSVTVVQGQEFLPANTGVASGLTMGLGFGLSGMIAAGLTTLSGSLGVKTVLFMVPLLPLAAAAMSTLVARPTRREA